MQPFNRVRLRLEQNWMSCLPYLSGARVSRDLRCGWWVGGGSYWKFERMSSWIDWVEPERELVWVLKSPMTRMWAWSGIFW